jgi:hypothetical protein
MSLLRGFRRRNRGRDSVIPSWREIWIQFRRDEPVGRGPELRLRSEDRRASAGSGRQVDGEAGRLGINHREGVTKPLLHDPQFEPVIPGRRHPENRVLRTV